MTARFCAVLVLVQTVQKTVEFQQLHLSLFFVACPVLGQGW